MPVLANRSRDPVTGRRTREVVGVLSIWRWVQFGAGAWTNTLAAASGQVTIDLNALDAATDSSFTGTVYYGAPDPGEPIYVGEDEPQWYGREYRVPFKVAALASGDWAALIDLVKAFVETTFTGELIFEANRNIERPPASLLTTPAKWLEWELEF